MFGRSHVFAFVSMVSFVVIGRRSNKYAVSGRTDAIYRTALGDPLV